MQQDGLTKRINFRATPLEHERVHADAKAAGLSVSEIARRRCLKEPIQPKTDLHMINELRRVGGLLKHSLVESKGAHAAEVAEALREVIRAIKRIHAGSSQ